MESRSRSGFRLRPLSTKRKKIDRHEDNISRLPDSILQHILSFLPMKDVKTRVLSKRWLAVWAAVPTLYFAQGFCPPITLYEFISLVSPMKVYKFVGFVDNTLKLYPGPKVEKLIIKLYYFDACRPCVDAWIRFAVERKVEELFIKFCGRYQLHESIYSNSLLRVLNMTGCDFPKPVSKCIDWNSLKILSIGYINLSSDVIDKILLGSPKLELFKLHRCTWEEEGNFKLTVGSLSLKGLVVEHLWRIGPGSVEILCPNVRSLSFLGDMKGIRFNLINCLSSLMEANLSYYTEIDFSRETCGLLKEYLTKFNHVRKLTIGPYFLQFLSVSEMLSLPSPLSMHKSLTLNTEITDRDLPGIVSLLQSSPYLENLTINMRPIYNIGLKISGFRIPGENYLKSMERNFTCLSLHLTNVEIIGLGPKSGFNPTTVRLKFFCLLIEFLLKNAKVLEKMVIYAESYVFNKSGINKKKKSGISKRKQNGLLDFMELNQLILSYPRASSKAVVQFKNIVT